MAVYTQLSTEDITAFLAGYDIGALISFKGIAEGVSNTNYLLTTNNQQQATNYILTLFEDNFNIADLPFILNFTGHLSQQNIICPKPIKSKNSATSGKINGKTAIIVEFLEGRGNPHITTKHTELLGELVAKLHLASEGFTQRRENPLSLLKLQKIFSDFAGSADKIKAGLTEEIKSEFAYLAENMPKNLPSGVVHTDIFPDNVFFIDGNTDKPEFSGIIDFYFSCNDFYIYDLMIAINAWCFDSSHKMIPERLQSLLAAYNKIRPISEAEKAAMPILGRAAALRFLVTRCNAWLNRKDGALVNIKDPNEYLIKLAHYKK